MKIKIAIFAAVVAALFAFYLIKPLAPSEPELFPAMTNHYEVAQSDSEMDKVTVTPDPQNDSKQIEPIRSKKSGEPPERSITPEELVREYFSTVYKSYLSFEDADLTNIMDFNVHHNHTFRTWVSMINQRRRLLFENELCFVDTEEKDYTIEFLEEDELEDNRINYWKEMNAAGIEPSDTEVLLHFVIKGTAGEAYAPFMSLNSQHSIRMRRSDPNAEWRIVWHYYPGAVRSFRSPNITLELLDDEEALEKLYKEFEHAVELPESRIYNSANAVSYALEYTESPNPEFYQISDWMGNCANFVSQCIWAGLHGDNELSTIIEGKYMNNIWFAGAGGGSPAWENVEYQWDYAIVGLKPAFPPNVNSLLPGDIVQSRTVSIEGNERFSHTLVLVDRERMMFAQNSPCSFVYYSDMLNNEYRFLRPMMQ